MLKKLIRVAASVTVMKNCRSFKLWITRCEERIFRETTLTVVSFFFFLPLEGAFSKDTFLSKIVKIQKNCKRVKTLKHFFSFSFLG